MRPGTVRAVLAFRGTGSDGGYGAVSGGVAGAPAGHGARFGAVALLIIREMMGFGPDMRSGSVDPGAGDAGGCGEGSGFARPEFAGSFTTCSSKTKMAPHGGGA